MDYGLLRTLLVLYFGRFRSKNNASFEILSTAAQEVHDGDPLPKIHVTITAAFSRVVCLFVVRWL